MTRLQQMLAGSPYQGYAYAYPHKTAYRRLPEPVPLRRLWAGERCDALFLYLHVPFCEMRCGFCNLFTRAGAGADRVRGYFDALRAEAEQVREALGGASFARMAVGGGTPTFLDGAALESLFDLAESLGAKPGRIPMAVETSPATAEGDKLEVLRARGVTRVSLGVQSFVEAEVHAAGRPQKTAEVAAALDRIRAAGFPTLNVDLIYGLPNQTPESWLSSVREALRWSPEELYLYPLYVRPLTGLGKSPRGWDDLRLTCYRAARDLLLTEGYEQVSMRMFRSPRAPDDAGPVYCCQDDGMVGLGCGARSYTRGLHYSREFAVGAQGVRAILADYAARRPEDFAATDYGFRLDGAEQRRRYVLQSLLQADGLDLATYRRRFATEPFDDVLELAELDPAGLGLLSDNHLSLTAAGLERSDVIGPWLYSARVRSLMEGFELAMNLRILYRGPLSSCNYDCAYCPFVKHTETADELAADRAALERFVDWVASQQRHTISVLFTPWGEALVRRWYQEALARLTHLPHVGRAAIQTNLSCGLGWIDECDLTRLALWTTYHPTEVSRERFVAKCVELDRRGVRFSVGAVGLREYFAEIEALRRELPPHVYLWVNAYKDRPDYYLADEARWLETIDPLFPINTVRHTSLGKPCRAGHDAISVDGAGAVRRCHFVREPLGNLYGQDIEELLSPRPAPCPNATCGCHIGYVYLEELGLDRVFSGGILERIPARSLTRKAVAHG